MRTPIKTKLSDAELMVELSGRERTYWRECCKRGYHAAQAANGTRP
jgi:hypothetical protein